MNAGKFIIAYYVMTRDVTKPFAPEPYTVTLAGLRGRHAAIRAFDPVRGVDGKVKVVRADDQGLTVALTASDYPCLLTIEEK